MKYDFNETEVRVGVFCPLPPAALLHARLESGKYQMTVIGLEKHCPKCKTYWPADTEFFYSVPSSNDGLNIWCRACYCDWRATRLPVYRARRQELRAAA